MSNSKDLMNHLSTILQVVETLESNPILKDKISVIKESIFSKSTDTNNDTNCSGCSVGNCCNTNIPTSPFLVKDILEHKLDPKHLAIVTNVDENTRTCTLTTLSAMSNNVDNIYPFDYVDALYTKHL